jgi:CTP:molybdopterin cytidylyltransferase MocA
VKESEIVPAAGMRVHALILAAGQSRRFGGGKLHALYRGQPLLSCVLDVVAVARKRGLLEGGHVVVAADDERAVSLARARGLNTVINDAPELGLSHSVRLGLTAIQGRASDAVAALDLHGDRSFGALLDSAETILVDVKGDNPDVDTPADLKALEDSSR